MGKGVSDEIWREANEVFRDIDVDQSIKHHANMDTRRRIEERRAQKELDRHTQEFDFDFGDELDE